MFAVCADDPVVAQHLDATFFVWPEKEQWIEVEPAEWFARLLVLSFLRTLYELCRRHLRRNYVRATENLTGLTKGRIRVGENIRLNLARARIDRTVCEYGRFDDDCLENRILRAALRGFRRVSGSNSVTLRCAFVDRCMSRLTKRSQRDTDSVPRSQECAPDW
jgi:hypothetical protein